MRELQPATLVSGRLGGRNQSDYASEGDNRIPAAVRPGDWETPATINDTWGFRRDDTNWKSSDALAFKLVDIVSKGGNYLLNVGPDARGVIPEPSRRALREVGEWLARNGEAIYGASPTPFGPELSATTGPRWRCTRKPGALYAVLFSWSGREATLELPGFDVTRARLLGEPRGKPLPMRRDGVRVRVDLGAALSPGEIPVLRLEHGEHG